MALKSMHTVSETAAWQDQMHADVFDYLHKMPLYIVRKHYENFNEGRLLKKFEDEIHGDLFFEIGCATGELYRYLSHFYSRFRYVGFDISAPAVTRAKIKYPKGRFHLLSSGIDEIVSEFGRPDVLWCRDVVMHQDNPYRFLDQLISLSRDSVILRLRTRDVGDTVFDSEMSCQLHWDKYWVPYIVLNTDELIQKIRAHGDVKKIVLSRHYEVLGGHNYRFLPKELYSKNTGTAETAVFIQKGRRTGGTAEVFFLDQPDRPRYSLLDHLIRRGFSLLKARKQP